GRQPDHGGDDQAEEEKVARPHRSAPREAIGADYTRPAGMAFQAMAGGFFSLGAAVEAVLEYLNRCRVSRGAGRVHPIPVRPYYGLVHPWRVVPTYSTAMRSSRISSRRASRKAWPSP